MNKTVSTILTVLTIVVLAGVISFAGTLYARANMMWGWSNENAYGRGMMGQGGMMNGYDYTNSGLAPLTIDEAKAAA